MMQNTPPVARGGFWWAVGRSSGVAPCRKVVQAVLGSARELVQRRWGAEDWTEWAPGVLESLGADEPTGPAHPMSIQERARILLALGMDFARVADVLQVTGEELLRVVPAVDGRVLLPPTMATTRVQRLREESW